MIDIRLLTAIRHGDIGEAPFLLEASSEVVVTTIDGAGTTLALHEIVSVFGLNLITADIAPNGITDDHNSYLLYLRNVVLF